MHAEINLTRPGRGSIKLDGHEISHTVRALNLEAAAGDARPRLTLDLALTPPGSISGEVDAVVSEATAQTLTALGWTPPGPAAVTVPREMLEPAPIQPHDAIRDAGECTEEKPCTPCTAGIRDLGYGLYDEPEEVRLAVHGTPWPKEH